MSSNSVCNHTCDKQIGLPLRGRPILLSLVWLQTELDSTQSYYHYLSIDTAIMVLKKLPDNGERVVIILLL